MNNNTWFEDWIFMWGEIGMAYLFEYTKYQGLWRNGIRSGLKIRSRKR